MFVFKVLSALTQAYRVHCKDKCYHLTKAGENMLNWLITDLVLE